ncbi:hypothetical protein [Limosilactobacillus sp.]|uniref:hypothetical protein n=1 Tax=Limosilactobacillus sp. TaxID=2773925 RepID=UPI0035A1904C
MQLVLVTTPALSRPLRLITVVMVITDRKHKTDKFVILGAVGVELAATLGLAGLAAKKKRDVE